MAAGNNERGEAQRERGPTTALAKRDQPNGQARLLLHSAENRRSVAFASAEVKTAIAAATTERERLLLRRLWAAGGRISEVPALRPADIQRDALGLPKRRNPSRPVKALFLSSGDMDLPSALLLWQKQQGLRDDEPLF